MQQQLKLAVGCGPAAYDFKVEILKVMEQNGYSIYDVGCDSAQEGLFATEAKKVADLVVSGQVDRGILLCGTGQGMAMAANKVPGVRAALCFDIFQAIMSREHNNANILCTGAWMITVPEALRMIEAWLFANYAGHHQDGLKLMDAYDREGREG